jgi:hypothetical protein
MKEQWRLGLSMGVVCALLSACIIAPNAPQTLSASHTDATQTPPELSTATFFFAGFSQDVYRLQMPTPISKLRHGHAEFTIDIVDGERSLIIVFIGYMGPATYQLTNRINGGDVRITLKQQYWDLSLVPTLTCTLVINSDEPTTTPGLHRMHGHFSCPTIPAGRFNTSKQAVTITNGQFDTAIIVES